MDLIDLLDLIGADDMRKEIKKAEAKVTEKEHTIAHLNQQINGDLSKKYQARNRRDTKSEAQFAGLAERRKKSLRREKKELRELQDNRDAVKSRIRGALREALQRVG